MKKADYQKIFTLADNIRSGDRQMLAHVSALGTALKTLKQSYHDEHIDTIEKYVIQLSAAILETQEAFDIIAGELKAYGEALKAIKDTDD